MKLKLLLFSFVAFFAGVLHAQNYPEGVYRHLVITEVDLSVSAAGFVEITNMGDKAVQLSEFKLAFSRGGDSGNFQIFDVWTDTWGSTYNDYMFLPDRILEPGKTFMITGIYDLGPRIYKETLGRGEGGSERPKQPEFYEVADKLIHVHEPVLGVTLPGDSVTTLYNDPEQTVQQGFNPYVRALFNPQSRCSAVYLEHHYTDGDSAVIDQAGGVFDNNGRNRQAFSYDVAGVEQATGRSVLVRKYGISQGNLDFANSRGVGLGDSEWMPATRPLPGSPNYSGWQWRDMWWTVGNHGDYVLDANTLESEVIEVDYANKRLTVPWGTLRLDEIMRHMKRKPGISWEYHLNANSSDSLYRSVKTGDQMTIFVYGRELQSATFDIVVKEPTADDNIVIPIDHRNATGALTTRTQNGILGWPRVTSHASGVDTITGSGFGLAYAMRTDTLLKYLEKPPKATWEFVWVDGVARPDLKDGDKLKITSESGNEKEYFIQIQAYSPSTNANLTSITWPDIPDFYRGIFGWKGDTIPNFTASNFQYVVEVPYDVEVIPALVARPASVNATVAVTRARNLTGTREDRTVTFEVSAELDTIKNTYRVEFVKEKHPLDIEPFFADPIISEVLIDCPNGNHYVELANPGNQPLDLSNYLISMRRSTNLNDGLTYGSWAMRYTSYIPGYKYVDQATWAATPKIMVQDPNVTPIIPGGGTFVMATITREYVSNTTIPYIYDDSHYDVQFANGQALDIYNPWNEAVSHNSGGGRPCVGPGNMGGWLVLWKVLNDSIKRGLKPVGDPNDFEVIDICGMNDGTPWVVAGVGKPPFDKNAKISRKPEVYQGNPVLEASFGTNSEDSEWIYTDRSYWQSLGFSSLESYFQAAADLGQHYMVPPTHYRSTVTSSVYKVSDGYGPDEEIFGVTTGTTVSAFFANINKEHEGQTLNVIRATEKNSIHNQNGSPWDGSVLIDMDELIVMNDVLVVLSADEVNTTLYRLDVTETGLSSDAYLTSTRWNIEVEVAPKSTGEDNSGRGSVSGFEYGTTVQTVVDNLTVPFGAALTVIDGNDAYVPYLILNFDTTYVSVTVNPDTWFEVVAEDGVTRMLYQLRPSTSAGDAFILSDVYKVTQLDNLIHYVPRGISVTTFMHNIIPSLGATVKVVDKMGFERSDGTIRDDDKVLVTSANGMVTRVYHIAFRATATVPFVTYLAYVLSDAYVVDQVNYIITGGLAPLTGLTPLSEFMAYITPSMGATAVVVDIQGNDKSAGDLDDGDMLKVTSADGKIVVMYNLDLDLTSADRPGIQQQIEIYPNPTTGRLYISGVEAGNRIQIYSATGALIRDMKARSNLEVVSVDDVPSGVFLIVISNDNRMLGRFKAIKK